ncbi:hypothetical protein BJ878DRAFT_539360 [Calycina marina]|uniref:Uncharacterized protein n=1 Tax=Calycina marina TaxID=1763456 RepID=A0A9P8CHI6_9HELO|nr:hypothetical protein BJ878DRAFT_539360 [Calycina marina]
MVDCHSQIAQQPYINHVATNSRLLDEATANAAPQQQTPVKDMRNHVLNTSSSQRQTHTQDRPTQNVIPRQPPQLLSLNRLPHSNSFQYLCDFNKLFTAVVLSSGTIISSSPPFMNLYRDNLTLTNSFPAEENDLLSMFSDQAARNLNTKKRTRDAIRKVENEVVAKKRQKGVGDWVVIIAATANQESAASSTGGHRGTGATPSAVILQNGADRNAGTGDLEYELAKAAAKRRYNVSWEKRNGDMDERAYQEICKRAACAESVDILA